MTPVVPQRRGVGRWPLTLATGRGDPLRRQNPDWGGCPTARRPVSAESTLPRRSDVFKPRHRVCDRTSPPRWPGAAGKATVSIVARPGVPSRRRAQNRACRWAGPGVPAGDQDDQDRRGRRPGPGSTEGRVGRRGGRASAPHIEHPPVFGQGGEEVSDDRGVHPTGGVVGPVPLGQLVVTTPDHLGQVVVPRARHHLEIRCGPARSEGGRKGVSSLHDPEAVFAGRSTTADE
jgi:hypothetical protein